MTTTENAICPACKKPHDTGSHRHRATIEFDGETATVLLEWHPNHHILSCGIKDAEERLLRRIYGARAWFWRDNGLPSYGQVMRAEKSGNGSNSLTGRVYGPVMRWASTNDRV